MLNYQDKKIVIVGLGITGLSCVNYFLSKNVVPKVIDTRLKPSGAEQLDNRVPFHFGDLNVDWLLNADLIVVSPGLPLSTPAIQAAKNNGVEIVGDIELFCREVNLLNHKKIAAITGANGKTTVTTLVGEIVKNADIKVGVGGNIGLPVLTLLAQNYDVYVLELSSFQLETTSSLHATVATILNISEDHTDRYPLGLQQYIDAKQRIYQQAKCCVTNADDVNTLPKSDIVVKQHTFGLSNADYHLSEGQQSLMVGNEVILPVKTINLAGTHNYLNALAALAIADELSIPRIVSIETIKHFKGLAHRFEIIHQAKGVTWINDSKATNVGSTEAALNSVICDGMLFLLLGGDGKSADFSPLLPYLQNRRIEIYCFGQDKSELAKLKPDVTTITQTMQDAMELIARKVKNTDVVLLSPACASLDQFKNYAERGQIFANLAKELG